VIVLELKETAVVSYISLRNRALSRVSVSIGQRDERRSYIQIQKDVRLPHNKQVSLAVGHLPCRYVRIEAHVGTPISFYELKVCGFEAETLRTHLGNTLAKLVYRVPRKLLFGPSQELALPPAVKVGDRGRLAIAGTASKSPASARIAWEE
jgi:hypothetical protein